MSAIKDGGPALPSANSVQVARWVWFVGFGAHDLAQRRKQWEAEQNGAEPK